MTGQIIVFPDVEQLAINVLSTDFDAHFGVSPRVPVGTRVPHQRPPRFVRLFRAGGAKETLVSENAWIVLEGWADQEDDAIAVLNRARAVLSAQDGPLFGYRESSGASNLPDPTTDQIRYTALVTVRASGTVSA